jgi:hypothetical protein
VQKEAGRQYLDRNDEFRISSVEINVLNPSQFMDKVVTLHLNYDQSKVKKIMNKNK